MFTNELRDNSAREHLRAVGIFSNKRKHEGGAVGRQQLCAASSRDTIKIPRWRNIQTQSPLPMLASSIAFKDEGALGKKISYMETKLREL